jgi:hypothetical protein
VSAEFFEAATPDCVADDFDGEIVAINMKSGIYYCVRELGAAIWRDLIAGHALTSIVESAKNLDVALDEPIRQLVIQLVREGLLRERAYAPAAIGALSFPSAWQAGGRSLEIENYDDMQDLVMADPIHDVDSEQGWPVRKPA